MGDKAAARETMTMCGVPTVPGSRRCSRERQMMRASSLSELATSAYQGICWRRWQGHAREVHAPEELADAFMAAKAEAKAAFANDDVYIEKLVLRPRHVEIQVLADDFGHKSPCASATVPFSVATKSCSEEAPSPALDETLRRNMAVAAVKAVRAVDYRNAGTIEFLLDNDGKFYFMEMNTRVQVEHPVTEQITGVDIIRNSCASRRGELMSCADEAPFVPNGHAIEFRINAEDPENGFRPVPRHHYAFRCSGRSGRARRSVRSGGFGYLAVLRLHGGEAHRMGPRS